MSSTMKREKSIPLTMNELIAQCPDEGKIMVSFEKDVYAPSSRTFSWTNITVGHII